MMKKLPIVVRWISTGGMVFLIWIGNELALKLALTLIFIAIELMVVSLATLSKNDMALHALITKWLKDSIMNDCKKVKTNE